MDEAVRSGSLEVDGKIVVKTPTDWINQNKAASSAAKTARAEGDEAATTKASYAFDAGVELNVSKAAVEPVWYLPGIAVSIFYLRVESYGIGANFFDPSSNDSGSLKVV